MGILRPLILLATLINVTVSLNILVFLLGTTQHERATMEFIAQQLALRHHTVVTVKPVLIPEEPRLVKPKLHLVREKTLKNLLNRKLYQSLEKAYNSAPWRSRYDYDEHLDAYYVAHNESCARMINSDLVDGLRKDSIDVAIVYSGNPCQLAICHVLGLPVIYFDQEGLTDETLVASGSPLDVQFPSSHCRLADKFSNPILARVASSLCFAEEMVAQSGLPFIASLASRRYRQMDGPITKLFREDYTFKKRFPSFPDVNTLKKKVSLYFVNSDPLIEYERALPPHVVQVGGVHLEHPKPLFAPWNTTIEQSKDGTIVVSFGTLVNTSAMTTAQASAIYGALSQLTNYRIVWNVGASLSVPGVNIEKTLPHINITSFLPQNDILADKRTKLLITNGGMNSIMEAVAYGVPIVGIPLYGVNKHNLDKVAYKSLGVVVNKQDLSQSNLINAIKTVLDSAKYKTVAKDMSREFKARQGKQSAFERAVHYIEHVGRHHGASFFRQHTGPFAVISLETALVLLIIFGGPLLISYMILTRTVAVLLSSRPSTVATTTKKEAVMANDSRKIKTK